MSAAQQPLRGKRPRLVFFDNLRLLMVLLVLVFHAGASYGWLPAFWPYRDPNPSYPVTVVMMILDTFMMNVLFFIAGFFALPSLRRRSGGAFLVSKLERLGIPWLVITSLVLPVLDYVHYHAQSLAADLVPRGYGRHWWLAMARRGRFHSGPMDMSAYLDMTQHFYQRYMWFISLLLLFFVILWLVDRIAHACRGSSAPATPNAVSAGPSMPVALALVAVLNITLYALLKCLFSSPTDPFHMPWISLGNLVQFEVTKLAFYVPSFGLGIYAYAKEWFRNGRDWGRPWVWGASCSVLLALTMLVARGMADLEEIPWLQQAAFLIAYPLWTFSFLGFWVSLAARRWNRTKALHRDLAANSYSMYLSHYVFVMTLPLLLSGWPGTALVKFGVVAPATILASYAVSRYAVRPHPRLTIVGLACINVALALLTVA